MIQFYSPPKLFKRLAFLFLLLTGINNLSWAQAPSISYPTAAADLTRGYSQGPLTVKIIFNSVCSGTVRLGLPASVTYVAGTVTKTGGTAGVSIAESSIADLSKPVFSISGVAAIGDEITFTVARRAGCGSLATAKDSVYFIAGAGCSDASEVAGTVNTYNLSAPALGITPATALVNTTVGFTTTRTTTVSNGGLGCTDTLRFYIVYPSAGIVNTNSNKITVSGTDFSPWRTNGDTLFYKIAGATMFGGDGILCNTETVTVSEPIRVAKCNTTNTYAAYWGPREWPGCQIATGTSSMTMATGSPNVLQISETIISKSNMCDSALVEATIRNNGTESVVGAGTAYSLIQQLGVGVGAIELRDQNTISKIQIFNNATSTWIDVIQTGGTSLIPAQAALNQFTTDVDGTGGLIDADVDGQFDDLPVGSQYRIRFKHGYVCASNCNTSNHSGASMYKINSSNQCGAALSGTVVIGTSTLANRGLGAIASVTGPSDISDGEVVTMRITSTRDFNLSTVNCPTNQLSLKIAVPKGISLNAGRYYRGVLVGTATTLSTSTITGIGTHDTLVIVGQQLAGTAYTSFAYEADLKLACSGYVSGPISYTISYKCDAAATCGCVETWYCGNIPLTTHCPVSCPDGGLTMTKSNMSRITGGYSSPTASTFVNVSTLSAKQLKYLMPHDTVKGSFNGVYDAGTAGHSFVDEFYELKYKAPGGAKAIEALTASLMIYNRTTGALLSTCPLAAPTSSSVSGGWHTVVYNLSACGINVGDSIVLEPRFYVMVNAAYNPSPTALDSVQNRFYATVSAGTQYTCDKWSAELYVNRSLMYQYSGPTINNIGCSAYQRIVTIGYQTPGYDVYPGEVRNPYDVDSIKVEILNGDAFVGTSFNLLASGTIADGYASSTGTITSITPVFRDNNKTAVFINGGSWPRGETYTTTNGTGYTLTINFTSTSASVAAGNTRFTYYYKTFAYSHDASVKLNNTYTDIPVVNSSKANITVANNTGLVQGVAKQHYWNIQISNPSSYTAPYIWMALEKGTGSGNISIDSVVLKPSNVVLTPVSTYGGTNKWYQLSTSGLASSAFQQARVYFKYTSCNLDSVLLKAGWDCAGYPSPDPTSYLGTPRSIYLKVDPQPSQVQLTITRQPGGGISIPLCTTDSALLILNSAQAANLVNPYVTIYPPAGMSLVSPIKVEYPLGSGDYQNATVSSISGGGYQISLNSHTGIGTNGMLGTALANPAYSPAGGDRQAKIKVDFTTDCSYSSGSSFTFYGFGSRTCGVPATDNGISATTTALNITGASATGSGGGTVSFGTTTVSCGTPTTFSLSTVPTGAPTQAGDTVVYTLPAGLVYAGGFTKGTNCTTCDIVASAASNKVKIKLQTGVAATNTLSYSFDVTPNTAGCGTVTVLSEFKRDITPLMCGATACGSSSVVIASGTSPNITLQKPNLVISNVAVLDTPSWRQAAYPANHVKVFYNNNGTQAYTANLDTVEFFCNASATVPFAKMPLAKSLPIGANDSDEYYIMMPMGSCSPGDVITTKIKGTTAGGTQQCICSESSFISAGVGLPLTFTNTSINAQNCAVNIGWAYSESGSDKVASFVIERSSNGAQYSPVASITAKSSNYVDVTPSSGKWYYRIKAIGVDGKTAYSNTLQATTSQCAGNTVNIYPNPASEQISIVLQGSSVNNQYELVDALGRTIVKGGLNSNSNNKVDVSGVLRGSYIIKIITDDNVTTHQVQIVK